jgi:hypothetical protein
MSQSKAHSIALLRTRPRFLLQQWENLMSRFVVHFMKDVLGENGREQEIRQCTVEVDAVSKTEATQLAKQKFCETQGLSDWSDHADRMQVKEGDFPS